jgi:hypothetical protein
MASVVDDVFVPGRRRDCPRPGAHVREPDGAHAAGSLGGALAFIPGGRLDGAKRVEPRGHGRGKRIEAHERRTHVCPREHGGEFGATRRGCRCYADGGRVGGDCTGGVCAESCSATGSASGTSGRQRLSGVVGIMAEN